MNVLWTIPAGAYIAEFHPIEILIPLPIRAKPVRNEFATENRLGIHGESDSPHQPSIIEAFRKRHNRMHHGRMNKGVSAIGQCGWKSGWNAVLAHSQYG